MLNKKPIILIIHSTLEDSGLTNIILNICKNLNYELFDLHLITLSEERQNTKWQEFAKLPIKLDCLNIDRVSWHIYGKVKLAKKIKLINPSVIHTHGFRAVLFANKFLKIYPWIATIHGDLDKNYCDTYGKLLGFYLANKELKALNNATIKIACSKTLAEILKKKMPEITFIQNGVDEHIFRMPNLLEKINLKNELGINHHKKILLSVGSLSSRKNPITIIEAFNKSTIYANSILIFIGVGKLMDDCLKIGGNENIIFLGNKNNVHQYLKAADIFISASKSEGLPNSVLEASMSGLPCILSNIPQHKEIFNKNASQAVFFEPESEDELRIIFNNLNFKSIDSTPDFSATKMTRQYEEKYLLFSK